MANVLFRGTKTFWKTKNSVEVVFLEHGDHDVLEIAAFEPVLCVEAPRIYLNLELVYPLLNSSKAFYKGSEETAAAISTFVFNRLFISKFLPTSKVFEIVVRREFEPMEQKERFELMMDRPENLVPHPSPFTTITSVSIREKWRIPFILVCLLKGLPSCAADQAIYERFAAGKSQSELVNAVAVALGTRIKSENEENLQRVAHSIVLAPQTPFPTPRFGAPSPRTLPEGFVESVQTGDQAIRQRIKSPGSSPVSLKKQAHVEAVADGEAFEGGASKGIIRNFLRRSRARSTSSPSTPVRSSHSLPADGHTSFFAFGGHHRYQRGHSDGSVPSQLSLVHPDSPLPESGGGSASSPVASALSPTKTPIYDTLKRGMGFHSSPSSPASLQHTEVDVAIKPPRRKTPLVEPKERLGAVEPSAEVDESHCEGRVVGDRLGLITQRDVSARDETQRPRRRTFSIAADLRTRNGVTPRSYPGVVKASGECMNDDLQAKTSVKKTPPPAHVRGCSDGRLSELLGLSKNRVVPDTWVENDNNDTF